jgi:phage terminase large subunit-like protein
VVDFFIPKEFLRERIDRDRVPYDMWAKHHNLILTEGKTTDWDFIKHSILQRNGQYNIKEFGYDRHFAGELVSALEKENRSTKGFGMGFISMASPTAEFERMVIGKEIQHLGCPILFCPVLTWNIANTIVVTDPANNMKPDKSKSTDRIDGTVAVLIGLGMYLNDDTKEASNPYKERGLRIL